jgi:tripartite-type tricarboxylate transporter receptor subunit TctC
LLESPGLEGAHLGDRMTVGPKLRAALIGVTLFVGADAAVADEWPSHPVSVVSPFATGTTCDIVAQTVLGPASSLIGQPFVLNNRPGGAGTLAVRSVTKASPDGYTLLLANSAMTTAVILHKSLPYDIQRDLDAVAMFGAEPTMLMAAPGKGYATLADLITAAKSRPGVIRFGSVGVGSASHIAAERFVVLADLNVVHVPYSGAADALADLAAGRIDFYFVPVMPALPLITQGKAVALAVSTGTRLLSLSGLPTLSELGYAMPPYLTWCGLAAPAKTAPEIIAKLNAAVAKALELPAVRTKLLRTGFLPVAMTPQEYAKFIADDVAAVIRLGKDAHIAPVD